jgi:SulP family sulfate permease
MALVVLLLGPAVGYLTMPALAGLLILVGMRTIKPQDIRSVWRTGPIQKTVVAVTFVLTMVVPLQYAVLVGVGLSVLLYVVQQSNQIVVKRRITTAEGDVVEVSPPASLPPHDVMVLQPYGSLFFASAPVFETALPRVTDQSVGSVVILRLRGQVDLGATFIDVLSRYSSQLHLVGSRLLVVSVDDRVLGQLTAGGVVERIGAESVYSGDDHVGAALSRAVQDATAWVAAQRTAGGSDTATS